VEWVVPPGQTCLDVKQTYNQGHYDACHNCGKDVHKELPFAVGTALSGSPPHRSLQAEFPHKALLMRIWRKSAFQDRDAVELVGEHSVPREF
jgi:hypothetical protein